MNELSLFTGAGGGLLGTKLLGFRHIGYVEWDGYCQQVIAQRIKDGYLDEAPIFGDIRQFVQSGAAQQYRGFADVVSGGFPCQDISVAGKGAGITGSRSGMWSVMADIVGEVRPRYVLVENSPALLTRGLGVVLSDLAALGYDCRWTMLGAADVGAPHQRDRFWLVAHAHGMRELQPEGRERNEWRRACNSGEEMSNANRPQRQRDERPQRGFKEYGNACSSGRWPPEPAVGRMAHGVAHRMDRLRAIGNGQVPRVVASAWRELSQ